MGGGWGAGLLPHQLGSMPCSFSERKGKKKSGCSQIEFIIFGYFGLFRQLDFNVRLSVTGRRWSNLKKKKKNLLYEHLAPSFSPFLSSSLPQNERGHIRSAMALRKLCHPRAGMSPRLLSAICCSYWLPCHLVPFVRRVAPGCRTSLIDPQRIYICAKRTAYLVVPPTMDFPGKRCRAFFSVFFFSDSTLSSRLPFFFTSPIVLPIATADTPL